MISARDTAESGTQRPGVRPGNVPTDTKVRLQYWSASRSVNAPDAWPEPLTFDTLDDAVTFAMTQAPAGREVAWLRTADGRVLNAVQIRRHFEMRRTPASLS